MNLALSNLAWDFKDSHTILTKLKNKNINRVEGVFSKIGEWDDICDVKIIEFDMENKEDDIVLEDIGSELSEESYYYDSEPENEK